jgi:hypothetical protein
MSVHDRSIRFALTCDFYSSMGGRTPSASTSPRRRVGVIPGNLPRTEVRRTRAVSGPVVRAAHMVSLTVIYELRMEARTRASLRQPGKISCPERSARPLRRSRPCHPHQVGKTSSSCRISALDRNCIFHQHLSLFSHPAATKRHTPVTEAHNPPTCPHGPLILEQRQYPDLRTGPVRPLDPAQ